jgi:uncharacterized 2Fe-2S/4Fe-4S cluster protein (DUF4445 family)
VEVPPSAPLVDKNDLLRRHLAVHVIRIQNSSAVCNAGAGEVILLACARAGIILSAPCGGRGRCGKCKVQLLEGQVAGDTQDAEGLIRACMAVPLSDITIAYSGSGEITGNEVTPSAVASEPKRRHVATRAGIALDVGTTTVSARLIDLDTSSALHTVSELNDQRVFGTDVMSRIWAARNGKTGELFNLINRQTERIITSFHKLSGPLKIEKLSVSGNTTMLHLFLNVDPSGMGEVPFTPVFLEEKELKGEELSLPVESVTVLPSIESFIGGDITAGLAVMDILNTPGPSLLIDIGTNGEMALCTSGGNHGKNVIYCCSTAAGPAFEGAEISCGMGGVKGAISGVEFIDGAVSITTIGNVPPVGVCGSGLIDAVAVMLKQEIIDETGRMDCPEKSFNLAHGVSITDKDIRQFQLAKSAILSGIRILCKNAGLSARDIKNVFIAGGFGFFINKQNAVNTGIFPKEFLDSISICGNLSLQGAEECLSTKDFIDRCKQIIKQCSVIDLAADPAFTDEFVENMLFNV